MLVSNENMIKKILGEMLFYEFKNIKYTFTSQQVMKSHKFFEYVTYLEANDLINICKLNHGKTFYTLTDWGRFNAICLTKRTDCPKEYGFLNREVRYEY